MNTRLSPRRSILLVGAFSWFFLPLTVYAGPGGGSGGHGGGGGSHGGGGAHTSGGASHVSSHAPSAGRVSPTSGGANTRLPYAGSSSRPQAYSPMNFVAAEDFNRGFGSSAVDANLSRLAGHGWSFLPSSGVSRPTVAATRLPSRPALPARVGNIPAILPIRPHHYPPHFVGGWYGGCFFNGFTNVCGFNPFFFGANYCFSPVGFWNCGYGFGYGVGYYDGYAYGPNYGPGYGPGYDLNGYPVDTPGDAQNTPGNADNYPPYFGNLNENAGQNAPQEPQQPASEPPTQIILKNGSAYLVTAYWVSNGQLYYRPVTGGLSHVPLNQVDITATVQANSRNGVSFQLTDHPPDQ